MEKQTLATLAASIENWRAPEVPADIPHGDMPGDKVEINQGHIQKANLIFPLLVPPITPIVCPRMAQKEISVRLSSPAP